jgi:hypothetical protein
MNGLCNHLYNQVRRGGGALTHLQQGTGWALTQVQTREGGFDVIATNAGRRVFDACACMRWRAGCGARPGTQQ